MNEIVVDASVVLRWAFEDEGDREGAQRVAGALVDGRVLAVCPVTFLPEVAGVLVRAIRADRITQATAEAVMDALTRVSIDEADPHAFARAAMTIALGQGLHLQDASYLQTAQRTGATLVTADAAQLEAAIRMGLAAIPLSQVAVLEA